MKERIKKFIDTIQKQIDRVKNEDAFLLFPPRVYEPAISHKLAEYLQDVFPKYNVDVEYDKYGSDAKKELENFQSFCTDNSTDRIRPDIIVHNRGMQIGNVLVMEIKDCKASKSSHACVDEKLKKLTKRGGPFGYSVGVLWLFGDQEELFFYINGIKYDDKNKAIKVLSEYENSSEICFQNFLRSIKQFKKTYIKTYTQKEMEQEIEDYENEYREDNEFFMLGEEDFKEQEKVQKDAENWENDQYEQYIQKTIEKYKQGVLHFIDFDYFLEKKDSESRKLWFGVWKDLYFLSTDSVLFDHSYCIKRLKELLEMALTHNVSLHILNDNEKKLAEDNLEFLTGWVEYQKETLIKKQTK